VKANNVKVNNVKVNNVKVNNVKVNSVRVNSGATSGPRLADPSDHGTLELPMGPRLGDEDQEWNDSIREVEELIRDRNSRPKRLASAKRLGK
jgi:hypothetical protein